MAAGSKLNAAISAVPIYELESTNFQCMACNINLLHTV